MLFFKKQAGTKAHLYITAILFFTLLTILASMIFRSYDTAAETWKPQPFSLLSDRARDITGAAAVNAPGFIIPNGLTGEGQIVAIADSGLDSGRLDDLHPDLRSTPGKMPKVVLLKSWAGRDVPDDPSGHGTHMAATIAGTGAASKGQFRGVAPGASIYFQGLLNNEGKPELPAGPADLFHPAYSAGARVHVNGWGGGPNTYGDYTSKIDAFVRQYPDFLPVFGAGNAGPLNGTLTSEANAKNALTVGASVLPRPAFVPGAGDTLAPATFSSRGPAGDGRIKPELLAPGSAVISARSRLAEGNLPGYPEYTRMQGTSMASAVAGGSSALLREYFKKHLNLTTPSAALVKAALINGARTGTGGPSKQGFGVIDLAGTIIALKEDSFFLKDEWFGVAQGDKAKYSYLVTDTTYPFKATLAWTDPPAVAGSAATLVNDLDLVVLTPDGKVFYGNHFLGKNTPDRTNNVEQVYLPVTVPGKYTVTVTGTAVRRNAVRHTDIPLQDYALVYGQAVSYGIVAASDQSAVALGDGSLLKLSEDRIVNLVNDNVSKDVGHIFPGSAVYKTPQRAYLAARLWRTTGVKALKTEGGIVISEMSTDARLGGYSLAPDAVGINVNNQYHPPDRLPAGVEVSAVINPLDQMIRNARAAYTERDGVVSALRTGNGQKKIYLEGDRGAFSISPNAVYSYEDSYDSVDTEDMPFGTGALEELQQVMPGMYVRLHLAPSTGEVQYLAVKRRVALGTVREVSANKGEMQMDNGDVYRLFPGAPVKRDRKDARFGDIKPGDHVAAVLLTDTSEVIGLVAYSTVIYGKVVEYSGSSKTLYLLDDCGTYRSFHLPAAAIIYRWGVRATTDAIATGCRARITIGPAGKEVWRLDMADTFYNQGIFTGVNKNVLETRDGQAYRLSESTRFFKNGYPVLPEDLLPGEPVQLEYCAAPPPTGDVLISVNARAASSAPVLVVSSAPLRDMLVVSGRTGNEKVVYLWGKACGLRVATPDENGKFAFNLPWGSETGDIFTIVAVDRRNGGVAGRQVALADGVKGKSPFDIVMNTISAVSYRTGLDGVPRSLDGPVTRAEAVTVMARLFNWPSASEWPLSYSDMADFPAISRAAAAEARARNVFNGYPDGKFLPMARLNRAEAAVALSALMRDLGLNVRPTTVLPYKDAADIPPWAFAAVFETTSAGVFRNRDFGKLDPLRPVTVREMATYLTRLLELYGTEYRKY